MENNHLILYATCPSCGAEEEVGRVINPEPEDYDQFRDENRKQLCGRCVSKQRTTEAAEEIVKVLAVKGLSAKEALSALAAARNMIFDHLDRTTLCRPLSEFTSGSNAP